MTASTSSDSTREVYKGLPTTLCAGCGHNSITNHLIKALYEYGVEPHKLAKMSGIGCSSKTPAYFVEQAHGFNGLHGRMPSAATGAKLANRELLVLGISGDGDTASIGLGQYCHMIRRNVDVTYIVENNGCYGLTKGQFSATADVGSKQKGGKVNEYATIDICGLAIELGATFVARSFSGDGKQLVPLLQARLLASRHGDSRRHQPVRHLQRSRRLDQELRLRQGARRRAAHRRTTSPAAARSPSTTSPAPCATSNSTTVRTCCCASSTSTTTRPIAIGALQHHSRGDAQRGEFVTGLLYVDTREQDLCERENLGQTPLARLDEEDAAHQARRVGETDAAVTGMH